MAKYRMTPKRRAALHRAQQASVRKRRRSRNKKIAVGVGVVGTIAAVGVLGYGAHSYVQHLRKPYRPSAIPELPTQLALPPGRSVTKIKRVKRGIPVRKGSFKVDSSGTATYLRRPRGKYNAARRAGTVKGYEKKVRSQYDGLSARTARRRKKARG